MFVVVNAGFFVLPMDNWRESFSRQVHRGLLPAIEADMRGECNLPGDVIERIFRESGEAVDRFSHATVSIK